MVGTNLRVKPSLKNLLWHCNCFGILQDMFKEGRNDGLIGFPASSSNVNDPIERLIWKGVVGAVTQFHRLIPDM
ncbi:hypothetical protein DNFV4_00039 [Nitrospira tepida]|uniref:Uncharacterized protein n=1 Tax=Nitrospira tepida TaxID=2973512 RepID=A0AA86MVA4_9BACT|nr:hypothetical protein DNFV4_00039 [Nitrospira tepida]